LQYFHGEAKSSSLDNNAANEAFERAASAGLEPNMIMYLTGAYGLEVATSNNIIFFWAAAANFTPILGAFLADTVAGRFRMIGFGSVLSLMVHSVTYVTIIHVFDSLAKMKI